MHHSEKKADPAMERHATPPYGLLVSCEHGGNRIPAPYRDLFLPLRSLLDSHRGFDPGALSLARTLATALDAPLLASTVSRLLVDLNRSLDHPRLHATLIRTVTTEQRQRILQRYYQPHRERVEQAVRQTIGEHGRVIHIAAHSFTPVLDGKVRNADIGLLYDPSRAGEVALCAHWKAALKRELPELSIRRNSPYAGTGDGLTSWLRRCFPANAYVGIELEINQKHVHGGGRHWSVLRQRISASLDQALVIGYAGSDE